MVPTATGQTLDLFINQKWLIMKEYQKSKASLDGKISALKTTHLELTLPKMSNDSSVPDIFFALHMPPKTDIESLQPFASSDDSSALLRMNSAYGFIAKLRCTGEKVAKGRKDAVTHYLSALGRYVHGA